MGSKNIFLQNEKGEYYLKVVKMQNVSYLLETFILQTSCLIALTYQSVQNPWVPEPLSKFLWVPRNPWNPCYRSHCSIVEQENCWLSF